MLVSFQICFQHKKQAVFSYPSPRTPSVSVVQGKIVFEKDQEVQIVPKVGQFMELVINKQPLSFNVIRAEFLWHPRRSKEMWRVIIAVPTTNFEQVKKIQGNFEKDKGWKVICREGMSDNEARKKIDKLAHQTMIEDLVSDIYGED